MNEKNNNINGLIANIGEIALNSWDFSWPARGNSTSTNIIGAQKPGTGLTAFFMGKIDDFAIWDRELSQEEIRQWLKFQSKTSLFYE